MKINAFAMLTFALSVGLTSHAATTKKPAAQETKQETKSEKKKEKTVAGTNPVVVVETSLGNFEIELDNEKAPISTKNFLRYVDEGFYNGTIFHRVIKDFMIQGGGFTKDMSQKSTHEQIKNEAQNGLKNNRGTVAMARTSVVDSASSQFFVNTVDNGFLNFTSPDPRGFGYAVFGHVASGMDVVDKIRAVQTTMKSGMTDVPAETVEIKSVKRK